MANTKTTNPLFRPVDWMNSGFWVCFGELKSPFALLIHEGAQVQKSRTGRYGQRRKNGALAGKDLPYRAKLIAKE
jgi:hypothetical protein